MYDWSLTGLCAGGCYSIPQAHIHGARDAVVDSVGLGVLFTIVPLQELKGARGGSSFNLNGNRFGAVNMAHMRSLLT